MAAWIGGGTKVIDLEGKMLLPGFGDAHLHPYTNSVALCDVSGDTVKETLAKFRQCAKDQKDSEWVQGHGRDQSLFEGGNPDKALLDKILSDRPALPFEASGHDAWVNSRALEIAGIRSLTTSLSCPTTKAATRSWTSSPKGPPSSPGRTEDRSPKPSGAHTSIA